MAVLQDVAQQAQLQAQLAALMAENAALKAKAAQAGTFKLKVSEKGALSLYGMGRFPVTLYKQQWRKVIARAGEIEAFIKANEATLTSKE